MIVKIEQGILLKPYAVPWRADGYRKPPGWTPDRDDWVTARAGELIGGWNEALGDLPPFEIALQRAEIERGDVLFEQRRPWPGWVPTNPQADPKITKAYRELFKRMNAHIQMPTTQAKLSQERVQWPVDGEYIYERGKLEPAMPVQLGRPSMGTVLTDLWRERGIKAEDVHARIKELKKERGEDDQSATN